eukprot:GFYU01010071.1.p1 GENE.GFYU01010071.1~~GFYU01010071.1.p1  ORF type:complete len:234 (+),score=52.07 GFYU01010071.1:148-849(+)
MTRESATNPIKGLLFDLDGTLTDSDAVHILCFQELLKGFGCDTEITRELYLEKISGRFNGDIFPEFLPQLSKEDIDRVSEEKEAVFRQKAGTSLVPLPGLSKLLEWMKTNNKEFGLVTNAPLPNVGFMLEAIKMDTVFPIEKRTLGSDCVRAKPHPEPYLEGMKKLKVEGITPADCVAFEDSISGATAAITAGIPTIGILTTQSTEALTGIGCVLAIKDFEDPKLWDYLNSRL